MTPAGFALFSLLVILKCLSFKIICGLFKFVLVAQGRVARRIYDEN